MVGGGQEGDQPRVSILTAEQSLRQDLQVIKVQGLLFRFQLLIDAAHLVPKSAPLLQGLSCLLIIGSHGHGASFFHHLFAGVLHRFQRFFQFGQGVLAAPVALPTS